MLNKKTFSILTLVLIILLTRVFLFDYYKIPSTSMLPTMKPDDIIIIKKAYFFSEHSFFQKFSTMIKEGNNYVFYKPVSASNKHKVEYVKRCYGLPGATVRIKKNNLNEGYPNCIKTDYNLMLFPHDSSYKWTVNDYGPLVIPYKGMVITLNSKNFILYKDLLMYEGMNLNTIKSKMQDSTGEKYCFKNNYFFMLGDNFYESEDSRYFGFVPEQNIIGRVVLIL